MKTAGSRENMRNEKRENEYDLQSLKRGKVYLVGAGPGDVGLLTLKGKEAIEKADCVIFDYLAAPNLLDLTKKGAEHIYVGKRDGHHTVPQSEINHLLIQKATEGKVVVRLKGGDPFIFGRGGEELEMLFDGGIDFEVIPGVTSAIAVPAYAGIPLTHRDHNSTVAFITGHEDPAKETSNIDWKAISKGIGTLVFLMPIKNLSSISCQLISHGRDPATPCAVIRKGTTPHQEVVSARLDEIAELIAQKGIRPPAVFVVGSVVGLREKIGWFEKKPLLGRKILITRARHQAAHLVQLLHNHGAEPISFPTIEIRPPENWDGVDRAIDNISKYDWIIFTSTNGVSFFMGRLRDRNMDIRDLKGIRIGAIGSSTAQCVEAMGIKVDLLPEEYRAEGILEELANEEVRGLRFLLPRAEKARDILPEELGKRGADVDVVAAYRTVIPDTGGEEIISLIKDSQIDLITFTSSSTVTHFVEIIGNDTLAELLKGITVASIGPITAEKAKELGIETDIMPDEYTIEGMIREIVRYYKEQKKSA